MAIRNTRNRTFATDTTFHVYNRGSDRRNIFVDDADRREFIDCFRRYLAPGRFVDSSCREYRKLSGSVAVMAYCLMPNHFHFVIHQYRARGLADLIAPAITGYVKYFNKRHGRTGSLFDGEYRSVPKLDAFEQQIAIAYVHMNHADGPQYPFCSHSAYLAEAGDRPDWVNADLGLGVFGGVDRYRRYLAGYAGRR